MKKIFAVLIISALIMTDLYSQNLFFEQTASDTIYFPFEIGNKWYYQGSFFNKSKHYNIVKTIVDTTANGTIIVLLEKIPFDSSGIITKENEQWIYTDGKYSIKPSSSTNFRGPIFDANIVHDSVISTWPPFSESYRILNISLFGNQYFGQEYNYAVFTHTAVAGWSYRTANTIGTTFFAEKLSGYPGPEAKDTFHLTGTLLNGETLGDTIFNYRTSKWVKLNSGVNSNLNSICFTNDKIGFVVGETGIILKTTDEGDHWNSENSGTSYSLNSVHFISTNVGFIAGDQGIILKTTDGGSSWVELASGANNYLNSIFFVNSTTGFAVGDYGTILKTTNAGNSWLRKSFTGPSVTLYSVFFVDSYTGFVAGSTSTLLKTTDGGNNWFNQILVQEEGYYSSVYFRNKNTGYMVGYKSSNKEGVVLKTEDGGKTWAKQYGAIGYNFNSLFFMDDTTGIAVGNGSIGGTILKTYLGTSHWIDQPSGVYDELNAVYIKKNKGYSVGNNGIILRIKLVPDSIYSIDQATSYSLAQNYPNPFNSATTIVYEIPENGYVTLKVYDILGREVATLVDEEKPAGSYEVQFTASGLTSGIYFYQLKAGDNSETKKMILLR